MRSRPFTLLALPSLLLTASMSAPEQPPATVVVDASAFLDEVPLGHRTTSAAALGVPWLFNDFGLILMSRASNMTRVEIPEAGTYHLYIRSQGTAESQLRVAIGGKVHEADHGNQPISLRKAGTFQLGAGRIDVTLMGVDRQPVLDVIVLTKNPSLSEDDLRAMEGHADVRVVREYDIPPGTSVVKFGDLTGDGRMDVVVISRDFSAHALDHDGRRLWSYRAPEERAELRRGFEAPGLVWDFDQDGHAEVVQWRELDGVEWLVVADGRTGEIERKTEWPTIPHPHEYSNFRLAVGRLAPGYPRHILVFTDSGLYSERKGDINVTAYDDGLNRLWQHHEDKLKDHLGHYVYALDLTGDGIDEVVVSMLVLDASGKTLWNRFDLFYRNHDHVDSYRFFDVDNDGRLNMVTAQSEFGVAVFDALTGEMLWHTVAEHTQKVEVGDFLGDVPGPQIVALARTFGSRRRGDVYLWGQLFWFDAEGNHLFRWPANPIPGNPVFVKGDWRGDGSQELFWGRFRITRDGKGELYFPSGVTQMFDFTGDGAEEVITVQNDRLRIYGSTSAAGHGGPKQWTSEYLQQRVANHTRY